MSKTIAYITDIHVDEQYPIDHGADPRRNWQRILGDVSSGKIDEIIFGGDIGEVEAYPWLFDSLKDYSLKITLGNHDRFNDVQRCYSNEFMVSERRELYYGYEDEFFKYLFLDSSSDEISSVQLEWLQQELHTSKKIILFLHHPVLAVDTEADRQFPLKNRQTIENILKALPQAVIIFCGHYHLHDEQKDGNITQYITPASSFQLVRSAKIEVDATRFGYRLVHIVKDQVTTEVIEFEA